MGLITKGNSTFRRDLYYAFPDEKMFGFHLFTQPILCIRDPEIAVDVFVKDFEHFTANGLGSNQEYDLSGGNILFLHGTQWKEMRNKISPFFTPAKVKAMMNSIDVTMPKAVKILEENLRAGSACDIGNLFTRMTNDVITQACFGIESDAFEKNSAFLPLADLFFSPHTNVMFTIKAVSQSLFKFLRLQSFDLDSSLFLKRIMKNLVEYRKENNVQGHDFVQGIIEILDKEHRTVDEERMKKIEYYPDGTRVPKFDFDELFLQALIIFIGGVESTASTMTWIFYELAKNQEMQDRCREEVMDVVKRTGSPLKLDQQNEIPTVLGAINEALRMYPAFEINSRICTKTYTFSDNGLTIEPGQTLWFPTGPYQRDAKHFPDPDTFDPLRWQGEKPGLFTTFGLGPRLCLGKSFALSQMILVVSRFLQNYKFTLNSKTKVPVRPHERRPINSPSSPVLLDISRIVD
ncbi:cytochrome P450 [Nesidiocoris tenuis]|nr:cytochrome P450 [Nesidiocoris tenuis]